MLINLKMLTNLEIMKTFKAPTQDINYVINYDINYVELSRITPTEDINYVESIRITSTKEINHVESFLNKFDGRN
jgi:hypothetical protein